MRILGIRRAWARFSTSGPAKQGLSGLGFRVQGKSIFELDELLWLPVLEP